MIETFTNLLLVVGVASIIGIGPYLALAPTALRHPALMPALIPNCGLALVSIATVPVLYANRPVTEALWLACPVAAGMAAIAWRMRRHTVFDEARTVMSSLKSDWPMAGTCLLVPLLLTLPAAKGGSSSVPWRIGVDQAGHLQVAQFLLKGGTFRRAAAEIVTETGESIEWQAIVNNLRAVRFSAYVNSDFMNKMHRVGYSAVVASLAAILNVDHVYRIGFLPLVIAHTLTVSLVYWFLRHVGHMPRLVSTAAAAAVGLNCNLQNVLYEGMYGQFFATPLIFLVFVLAFMLRSETGVFGRHKVTIDRHGELLNCTLFLAFIWAAIMTDFAEAFLIVVPTLFVAFVLDRLSSDRPGAAALLTLAAAFTIGTVLVLPQSVGWFSTLPFRIGYIATSGFWQPYWAWPTEILGFKDIYANSRGYLLQPRPQGDFGIVAAGSLAVASIIGSFLRTCTPAARATWLSPMVYCAAVLVKNLFVDQGTNYQYMKSYTLWLPPLSLLLTLSLWRLRHVQAIGPARARLISLTGLAMIAAVGLRYHWTLYHEADVIGPTHYEVRDADAECHFDQYVFLTMPVGTPQSNVLRHMMVPLMPFNWLNEGNVRKNFIPHAEKRVALFFNKPVASDVKAAVARRPDRVIFENGVFLFYDTGLRLQDVISENGISLRHDLIENTYAL
jgi:hypothetical protein